MIMDYLILNRLDRIVRQLKQIHRRLNIMSETIDQLTARVTEIEDAGDAAIALLGGLKAALDAAIANNDMTAVQTLADRLDVQADELAAAVVANTVSA